jgi:hypothetical protein
MQKYFLLESLDWFHNSKEYLGWLCNCQLLVQGLLHENRVAKLNGVCKAPWYERNCFYSDCLIPDLSLFQGMDADNERMIFELLVTTARQNGSPQYFLLTPKVMSGYCRVCAGS